jgi:dihydroorotate dehydrogenase
MYSLLRPIFFKLDPEKAHNLALKTLQVTHTLRLNQLIATPPAHTPRMVMGINFPNPIGLSAGLDKNGKYINCLASLGFGFIEIGTVTPLAQMGNPKPRLFRLPQAEAIINRMGFNNDGVDQLISNIQHANPSCILGINIGKNAVTSIENAADDYLICMRKIYTHASYIAINISSPNTKNLRQLQDNEALDNLLKSLKAEQKSLSDQHGKYVPIALKIAPDLERSQVSQISQLLLSHQIDGVIATNTTLSRSGVQGIVHGNEAGGLSGAPTRDKSTQIIRQLAADLQGAIPIIGVGGIMKGVDAAEKMAAGASLIQLYSGLIYRGPSLIHEANSAIKALEP